MVLNPSIILAGQPVNALAAMDAGTQAAGRAGMVGQQGDLLSLYRDQGPGIMSGDPNALNALARLDPMAGLGVQESRQGMQIREEQLQMARAAAARQAEAHAASMTAAERQQQAQALSQGLSMAIPAIQSGNLDQVNAILSQGGLEPVGSIPEAQLLLAQAEGAFEVLERFNSMQQEGPRLENVGGRLYDLSQYDGTPGSLSPLTEGGNTGLGVEVLPDGTIRFGQGMGGSSAMPMGDVPPPAPPQPLEGADQAFGLGGAVRGLANTAADALGAGVPFPETLEAQTTVNLAAEDLLNSVAGAYNRQPPSWLLQEIRRLIPRGGEVTTGPTRAAAQYGALQRRLETEITNARRSLTTTRNPQEIQEIFSLIRGHETMLSMVGQITGGMQPQSGVSDDDAALIQRYLD